MGPLPELDCSVDSKQIVHHRLAESVTGDDSSSSALSDLGIDEPNASSSLGAVVSGRQHSQPL
jgi:hypothetical protein